MNIKEWTLYLIILKNSKTSEHYGLLPNLLNKINFIEEFNMILYQILSYTIHRKNKKVIQKQWN